MKHNGKEVECCTHTIDSDVGYNDPYNPLPISPDIMPGPVYSLLGAVHHEIQRSTNGPEFLRTAVHQARVLACLGRAAAGQCRIAKELDLKVNNITGLPAVITMLCAGLRTGTVWPAIYPLEKNGVVSARFLNPDGSENPRVEEAGLPIKPEAGGLGYLPRVYALSAPPGKLVEVVRAKQRERITPVVLRPVRA